MTIYHPASWAYSWPKDARPFASRAVAISHGHADESLVETAYNGDPSFVITEAPSLRAVPEPQVEPEPSPALETQQPEVAQAPASPTAKPSKKGKK